MPGSSQRLHAQQFRKDQQTPYIAHLLSVAALVLENQGTEAEAIAALLHDAIEDQGGQATRELIRSQFGDEITAIIEGCTDSDTHPKPPWQQRKQRYLQQLQTASPTVRKVSLADKLHNARSLLQLLQREGQSAWDHFRGGEAGTLWFYQSLLDIYQTLPTESMLQELQHLVQQLKAFN
jgi:(p)ppGpp synthase/HD superfamily hydrolase